MHSRKASGVIQDVLSRDQGAVGKRLRDVKTESRYLNDDKK